MTELTHRFGGRAEDEPRTYSAAAGARFILAASALAWSALLAAALALL